MKIEDKLMTMYTWYFVQQMLISLTYPFNIVHCILSDIIENRTLNSLAIADRNVWRHVETTMFANLTSAIHDQ